MELLSAAILSASAKKTYRESFEIVFLLKPESVKKYAIKPTLAQLVLDDEIADTDIDCMLLSKTRAFFIQLSRLVNYGNKSEPMEELFRLIEKKSLAQLDNYLVLVIMCDTKFDLDSDKLSEFVVSLQHFPYVAFYIIGQFGNVPKIGLYHCMQIFPVLCEPQPVNLYLY